MKEIKKEDSDSSNLWINNCCHFRPWESLGIISPRVLWPHGGRDGCGISCRVYEMSHVLSGGNYRILNSLAEVYSPQLSVCDASCQQHRCGQDSSPGSKDPMAWPEPGQCGLALPQLVPWRDFSNAPHPRLCRSVDSCGWRGLS